jgi:hypothetical protein
MVASPRFLQTVLRCGTVVKVVTQSRKGKRKKQRSYRKTVFSWRSWRLERSGREVKMISRKAVEK